MKQTVPIATTTPLGNANTAASRGARSVRHAPADSAVTSSASAATTSVTATIAVPTLSRSVAPVAPARLPML